MFGDKSAIYAYRTDIVWDDAASCLIFREGERMDVAFTQFGEVAVPHQSGHIYLVTNRAGQHRLITVSRPTITGEMYGILTTLLAGRGSLLTPIAAPIASAGQGLPTRSSAASVDRRTLRRVSGTLKARYRRAICVVPAGIAISKRPGGSELFVNWTDFMQIDASTVLLSGIFVKLLLGTLFLVFWLSDRRSPWFGWWSGTYFFAALAASILCSAALAAVFSASAPASPH